MSNRVIMKMRDEIYVKVGNYYKIGVKGTVYQLIHSTPRSCKLLNVAKGQCVQLVLSLKKGTEVSDEGTATVLFPQGIIPGNATQFIGVPYEDALLAIEAQRKRLEKQRILIRRRE